MSKNPEAVFPPLFSALSGVEICERVALRVCSERGISERKLRKSAASFPVGIAGRDNWLPHSAAIVLFYAKRFRLAQRKGMADGAAHYALKLGIAAGEISQLLNQSYDAQERKMRGSHKAHLRAEQVWLEVQQHLAGRPDRPTGAVLYGTLKIRDKHNKSKKWFQAILKKNGWRKEFPKVAK
jgi:hypothetical protein